MEHQSEQHRGTGGILGSILGRGPRPRSSTTNGAAAGDPPLPSPTDRAHSPPLPPLPPLSPGSGHRRRAPQSAASPAPPNSAAAAGFGHILRRRRSANAMAQDERAGAGAGPVPASAAGAPMANASALIGGVGGGGTGQRSRPRPTSTMAINHAAAAPPPPPPSAGAGSARRIRLVPHLENARSLHWDAITRDVRPGDVPLRIGRFTDRNAGAAVTHSNNKLAFRSKVVSRGHAEIWLEGDKFYIRDTKSSSGTFLNHIRLAPPNTESRPVALKDGDILQLGVDYQGGTEEIYRCVKMRIEVGREWQNGANAFNQNALAQLRALANPNSRPPTATAMATPKAAGTELAKSASAPAPNGTAAATPQSTGDCCICLFAVTVCQALFIAPCSHAFHYKCIRPLLTMHHPGFNCPLCRTFADLNADVEVDLPPPAPEPVEATHPAVVDLTMADEEEDADGDVAMNVARSTTLRRNRSAPNLADETDAEVNPPVTATALRMPMAVAESDAEPDDLAGGTINAHSRGPSASAVSRSTLMLPPPPPTPGGAEAGATLIPGMSFSPFMVPGPSSSRERERDDEMEVEIEMAVDEEGSEREGSGEGADGDGEGSGESGRSGSKRRRR